MHRAFILINCQPGNENSIIKTLKEINQVKKVQGTYGAYDVIASMESDSQASLYQTIVEQIRKIKSIHSTQTLIDVAPEVSNIPEIVPDVIPDEKKPLGPPDGIEFEEEDEDDDEDYYEEKK